jgi:hypothetical protein
MRKLFWFVQQDDAFFDGADGLHAINRICS